MCLVLKAIKKYLYSRFMIKFIQYFNETITSYIKILEIKGYFNIFSSKSVKKRSSTL